jgi:hypothetical protein
MKNVARYDRGMVQGEARFTDEGYIRAHAVVTRTGVFKYQNPDGSIRRELRHPDDVWTADSISSMEMIPVTNGHPAERLVTAENAKRLAIGYTGETIKKNGAFVLANMVITDQEGVDAVMQHNRKELSLGYTVDVEEEDGEFEGEPYDARQRNIRYNHLAIVDKARAGNEARIALDSQDAFEILTEVLEMAKRKIKIDNEEVMVEESTADYIDRLERDLKNLTEEKARVDDEIRMIRDKLDKAEAEKDSMRDKSTAEGETTAQVKMAMDSADFRQAVAARAKLQKVAEEHLDSDELVKLDSMSDQSIMKSVIQKCRKSVNLDGKSEVYIQAMFDTVLDDRTKHVNLDNVVFQPRNDADSSESITAKARQKMMETQQNAHKGGK